MGEYKQFSHSGVPRVEQGPNPPAENAVPCCEWCGWPLHPDCPSDFFDLDQCATHWRQWHNGAIPEASPIEREWVFHRDGVPWSEAPLPPAIHQCEAWSSTRANGVERCACGANRYPPGEWWGKNTRSWRSAA